MRWLIHASSILVACGTGDVSLPVEAECNPLGVANCMTPWPSSVFEIDDPATVTGRRLAIPASALPRNVDDIEADPSAWNTADGFSAAAPMVIAFPGGVSPVGLPPVDNMDFSLVAESPTIILDMTTGARIPHFAELDSSAEATPDSQALLLRPAARLAAGHRYAVAITDRVLAKDGSDLVSPPGFAALRDGRRTDHPLLEAMRPRFQEVIDALDEAGIPEAELVVAWDFTVASDASTGAELVAARELAVSALRAAPSHYTITGDHLGGDGARVITGTLAAPLFLSNSGERGPATRLVHDAAGLPMLQGSYRIPFTAVIPACASRGAAPVPMVVYGHGLFGEAGEVAAAAQRTTAAELCMVLVGTEMRGMSDPDLPALARVLYELGKADELFDALVQGLVDQVALVHAMRGSFADELFVDGKHKLVDRSKIFYYGVSQGAILGATVIANEPAIARGALAVGAANFSLVIDRSVDWRDYRAMLRSAYPDPLDSMLAINLFQMRWDRVETSSLAGKQVLLQIAHGDEHVPNIASYWQARTLGISLLVPSPTTPWGLPVHAGPLRSAIVILDGGAPRAPAELDIAAQPAARRQIRQFFTSGTVANECAGPCFCGTGACD
ncbi:MAG: hypothetical protein ABI867_44075 [Kofleriaceae bacterium]